MGVRGFSGWIFVPKMPTFAARKRRRRKFSFSQLWFWSPIFVTARSSGGFCATSSVFCRGCVFVGLWCAFLCGFFMRIREFFLRRFRASGAVVSGSGSSSLLFLLLLPCLELIIVSSNFQALLVLQDYLLESV